MLFAERNRRDYYRLVNPTRKECGICQERYQSGWVHRTFDAPLPKLIAMRINRYSETRERRGDFIQPELSLTVQDEEYTLLAFVEHLVNPLHYVTWIRREDVFEKRDDAARTIFPIDERGVPCTGKRRKYLCGCVRESNSCFL